MVLTVVLASLATLLALMRNAAMYDANTQMKYLMVALHQYASEYGDGHLPPQNGHRGLLALYSLGILGQNDTSLLLDPRKWPRGSWSELPESDVAYWYVGGHSLGESRDCIVLVQKKRGAWGYVGYLDGRILYESGERWATIRSSTVEAGQEHR